VSLVGSPEPEPEKNAKPPKRHWEAAESFFDLKASHWVQIVLTIVLGCIAFAQYTVYNRQAGIMDKQADIATKQNDIAERSLLATERAWIWPTISVGGDLIFTKEGGGQIVFDYVLENTGNTPALDTEVQVKMFPLFWGRVVDKDRPQQHILPQSYIPGELQDFCRGIVAQNDKMHESGFSHGDPIFPNKKLIGRHGAIMGAASVDEGTQLANGQIQPVLLFCVSYRFPVDKKSHYTGLAFILAKVPEAPNDKSGMSIVPAEGTIPANRVDLIPQPFRSGDAD
jgi:hypothetical protein